MITRKTFISNFLVNFDFEFGPIDRQINNLKG